MYKFKSHYLVIVVIIISLAIIGIASFVLINIASSDNSADKVETYTLIMEGRTMEPTIRNGQRISVKELESSDNIKRDDIVVYDANRGTKFIKRVIGLPGESIALKNGIFYINGKKYTEAYKIYNENNSDGEFMVDGANAMEIPENEYFVVGDYRDTSLDSRHIGFIKREWIEGIVEQ